MPVGKNKQYKKYNMATFFSIIQYVRMSFLKMTVSGYQAGLQPVKQLVVKGVVQVTIKTN